MAHLFLRLPLLARSAACSRERVNARGPEERPYDITEFDLLTVVPQWSLPRQRLTFAFMWHGRWDATSALKNIALRCQQVSLDHTRILGDTL